MLLAIEDVALMRVADFTHPPNHPLAGEQGLVNAFVIRHPHGVVLIDSGIGVGNERLDAIYGAGKLPLSEALSQAGIQLNDVVAVINTHLHFDHCGGNSLFAGFPIYVQAAEYEAAHQPRYTIREWVDFPGARYEQLDGEAEILPGVSVLPSPGHTAGHQSVLVDTSSGPVLVAGQAIYCVAEYESLLFGASRLPAKDRPPDPAGYLDSRTKLVGLNARRVLFSHDASIWNSRRA